MADVTTEDAAESALSAADKQLLREFTERSRVGRLRLTREADLLEELAKMVIEGEMDDHLGYAKHDPGGRGNGNPRNEYRVKTVLTGAGPVAISVPRPGFQLRAGDGGKKGISTSAVAPACRCRT
jgi:putative transposase